MLVKTNGEIKRNIFFTFLSGTEASLKQVYAIDRVTHMPEYTIYMRSAVIQGISTFAYLTQI